MWCLDSRIIYNKDMHCGEDAASSGIIDLSRGLIYSVLVYNNLAFFVSKYR